MIAPVQIPENPGPIIGAGDKDILEASLPQPNMRETLVGWNRPMTFGFVATTIVDGESREVIREVSTTGTIQPMKARQVQMKPEGQRAWRWKTLHTVSDLGLKPQDIVVYKAVRYRVMGTFGYEDYGFWKYELVEDYGNEPRG